MTNLVTLKNVTKSRFVTKFMVCSCGVSINSKFYREFKTMIYSKIIICLSVFQEQIFYYKSGNQMTPFFHEHVSEDSYHKQIFHHKLSNLMASFFHDHEPITFMSKEVIYQQIFHHKSSNLMALFFHEHESVTLCLKKFFLNKSFITN